MKKPALLAHPAVFPLALLLVLPVLPASAQLSGTTLNVGTNSAPAAKSGVIGNNNQINGTSTQMNFLSGDSNWINGGTGNFLSGVGNGTQWAYASSMFGAWNSGNVQISSMMIGTGNTQTSADTSLAIGYNNQSTGWIQILMGWGLIGGYQGSTTNNPTMIVGSYNVDKADQRFVVGVGTGVGNDANTRKNGLEVSKTGQVTIQRQGDLKMGRFGNVGDQ